MPRDINGNYTLPLPDVIPGTIIESDWANTTMDDIAAALQDSLSRSGDGGMLAPFAFTDGSEAAPAIAFTNEPSSGWYRAGLNDFRFSVGGNDRLRITAANFGFGDFFEIDDTNQTLEATVTPAVGTPLFTITGVDFSITRDGQVNSDSIISAGSASWGDGAVALRPGAVPDTGHIEWLYSDGNQASYLGQGTVGGPIKWGFFGSGVCDQVAFLGGFLSLSNATDTNRYNSSMLSLNTTSIAVSGLAVHNTAGGGGGMTAETFMWGGAVVGSITMNGSLTAFNTTSDRRLKEDVRPLTAVGDLIDRIEPVRFKWKRLGGEGVGFIAQDVVEIVPEAVVVPTVDSETPWQMDAGKLMPYVIAELKALRSRVDQLEG